MQICLRMWRLPRDKNNKTHSSILEKVVTKGLILGVYTPLFIFIYASVLYDGAKQYKRDYCDKWFDTLLTYCLTNIWRGTPHPPPTGIYVPEDWHIPDMVLSPFSIPLQKSQILAFEKNRPKNLARLGTMYLCGIQREGEGFFRETT